MKKQKSIGIIGGAGPFAGALMAKMIFKVCQEEYNCVKDRDFPKLVLLSIPFSEMLQPGFDAVAVEQELKNAMQELEMMKVDLMAIACNTLHAFVRKKSPDFIDIVDLMFNHIRGLEVSKPLVISTRTSTENNLYTSTPQWSHDEQDQLDSIIELILRGGHTETTMLTLRGMIQRKINSTKNYDCVVLGCSEFSVLNDHFPIEILGIRIVDPLLETSKLIVHRFFTLSV